MGATLCTQDIYNAFYHKDRSKMFFHSSSFTGNAIACAAANASLDIWNEEPVMERIQTIAESHRLAATQFAKHLDVQNVRTLGTILALDIQEMEQNYLSTLGPRLYDFFLKNNVLLRPLGNTVYILPPYCISQKDLEEIYDIIALALDHFRHDGAQQTA
jgi:adenosylmethionine-8-amino-7-oxononanoate aminotransferase